MTDIIRTPTGSGRRPTPVAVAVGLELLLWAGIVGFILFALRSCGT